MWTILQTFSAPFKVIFRQILPEEFPTFKITLGRITASDIKKKEKLLTLSFQLFIRFYHCGGLSTLRPVAFPHCATEMKSLLLALGVLGAFTLFAEGCTCFPAFHPNVLF
jgi:hypothetical protein